jgi:hypothetical protein
VRRERFGQRQKRRSERDRQVPVTAPRPATTPPSRTKMAGWLISVPLSTAPRDWTPMRETPLGTERDTTTQTNFLWAPGDETGGQWQHTRTVKRSGSRRAGPAKTHPGNQGAPLQLGRRRARYRINGQALARLPDDVFAHPGPGARERSMRRSTKRTPRCEIGHRRLTSRFLICVNDV